jgi:hypothetical protein
MNAFGKSLFLLCVLAAASSLTGCDLGVVPIQTPTVQVEPSAQPTASASPSPTPTRAIATLVVATLVPQIESPSPTWTPGPPTETFTPSPTPGPFEYTIQSGDTLLYIIQQSPFNYRDTQVLDEILRLNPQISSIDRLPPPGSVILIPRQTATPTPAGFELTRAVLPPVTAAPTFDTSRVVQVTVKEGETILGIAEQNATSLSILATLNPDIDFIGCDFDSPFGGSGCSVLLVQGQAVNVPALTPTPTLSPTFSGSETPTATPTYAAPIAVFPPRDASASARTFLLQWLSAGVLQPQQVYVVQIEDSTAGTSFTGVTTDTSYELPRSLLPADGQTHQMRWRVSVGEPNNTGAYRLIGGEAPWNTFYWQSR